MPLEQRLPSALRHRGARVCRWVAILLLLWGGSPLPAAETGEQAAGPGSSRIFLVNHGWHVGIVLPRAALPDQMLPLKGDFPAADYLEVGWGDMAFYRSPRPTPGKVFQAVLLPTASVIHIVGFQGLPLRFFPNAEIVMLEVSANDLHRLFRAIATSLVRNEQGETQVLGRGLYGDSRFYASGETYHLLNNCNVWTARVLQACGLPVRPAGALTAEALMVQVRPLGALLQSAAPRE